MTKGQLQLLAGIITAGTALSGSLLPMILPVGISTPIVAFIGTVSMEVIIFLGTENPQAQKSPSSP